jgi:hypothetical protein
MSEHCGTTTEEGTDVCIPGACGCSSEAKNNEAISLKDANKQPIPVLSNTCEEKIHVEENS